MNKLTKVGLSALCGSLAAVSSAYAGEMSVAGGITATHTSNTGDVAGNPLGMNSGLTFTGTGELDGGQTFTVNVTLADAAAYSAANLSLVTNSIGTFKLDQGAGGGGIGGYDDVTPTAWEESWGAGLGAGVDLAKGVGSSMNIMWTSPTILGSVIKVAYSPRNGAAKNNDKAASGDLGAKKQGYDILLDINTAMANYMPNIFIGGSESELEAGSTGKARTSDHQEVVVGLKYAIGPLTLGAQTTGEFTGSQEGAETEYYHNRAFGVAFNVSDNLSISYGKFNSRRGFIGKGVNCCIWNTSQDMRETEADSLQLAYTMGGASIKIAENSVDNASYQSTTTFDKDGTTVALTLAF